MREPRWVYRLVRKYRGVKSWIWRKGFQIVHGFDPSDTWDLSYTCAKWILPRLRWLERFPGGCPGYFTLDKNGYPRKHGDRPFRAWEALILKMIYAFEYFEDEDFQFDEDPVVREERCRRAKAGLRAFAEFYGDLWS